MVSSVKGSKEKFEMCNACDKILEENAELRKRVAELENSRESRWAEIKKLKDTLNSKGLELHHLKTTLEQRGERIAELESDGYYIKLNDRIKELEEKI